MRNLRDACGNLSVGPPMPPAVCQDAADLVVVLAADVIKILHLLLLPAAVLSLSHSLSSRILCLPQEHKCNKTSSQGAEKAQQAR